MFLFDFKEVSSRARYENEVGPICVQGNSTNRFILLNESRRATGRLFIFRTTHPLHTAFVETKPKIIKRVLQNNCNSIKTPIK